MDRNQAAIKAIFQQESGGDYKAYNKIGNAYGKYQFQPRTWGYWAKVSGYGKYANVLPNKVPPKIQDAVATRAISTLMTHYNGDIKYVAAAWYAGQGNADRYYKNKRLPTKPEKGGPSIASYCNQVSKRYSKYVGAAGGSHSLEPFNKPILFSDNEVVPEMDYTPISAWKKLTDPVVDNWVRSPIGGDIRRSFINMMTNSNTHMYGGHMEGYGSPITQQHYTPDKDTIDRIHKELPESKAAQDYVLLNATSAESLERLLQAKKEDIIREQRISEEHGFVSGLGKTLGFATAIAGDYLTYIPLGQEAVIGKALARLGKTGLEYGTLARKALDLGEIAASNALLNVGSEYATSKASGFDPDYKMAALLGGTIAPLVHGVGQMARNRATARLQAALDTATDSSIARAVDSPIIPDNVRTAKTRDLAFDARDTHYDELTNGLNSSEKLKKVLGAEKVKDHQVVVLDREQANRIANDIGANNPKGNILHVPNENYTILIKDKHVDVATGKILHSLDNMSFADIDNQVAKHMMPNLGADVLGERSLRNLGIAPEGEVAERIAHLESVKGRIQTALDKSNSGSPLKHKDKVVLGNALRETKKIMRTLDIPYKDNSDCKEFLSSIIDNEIDNIRGYKTLDDGTVIANGWRISPNNILNPNQLQDSLIDLEDVVSEGTEAITGKKSSLYSKIIDKSVAKVESNGVIGTAFGNGYRSTSKTHRAIIGKLLRDPVMRELKDGVPSAEFMKDDMLKQMMPLFENYRKHYDEYRADCLEKGRKPLSRDEYESQILDMYNTRSNAHTTSRYNEQWDEGSAEGYARVKELRQKQFELLTNNGKEYGVKGHMKFFGDAEGEFYRQVDILKWRELRKTFGNDESKVQKFLFKYAYANANDEELAKFYPLLKQGTETLEEFKIRWSDEWATGIGNQAMDMPEEYTHKVQGASFLKARFPMNTGAKMQLPDGTIWCFDDIRDTDLSQLLYSTSNRIAGELALSNHFSDFANIYKSIEHELEHSWKELGQISVAQANEEKYRLLEAVAQLRGVDAGKPITKAGMICDLSRKLMYAENSGNFGYNQLAETGQAMGYCGLQLATSICPDLLRGIKSIIKGKDMTSFYDEIRMQSFGSMCESNLRLKPISKDSYIKKFAKEGDVFTEGVQVASNALDKINIGVSFMNMLPKLTDGMFNLITNKALGDFDALARGKTTFSLGLRTPFSEVKLKAAGIKSKEELHKIVSHYNEFITRGADGSPIKFNDEGFCTKYPHDRNKWKMLIDNQSRRAMQQFSIGNDNVFRNKNAFTKLLCTFRSFALMTINNNLMRALTHHEIDDMMATIFSIATNGAIYAGLTGLKAQAYFSNDEEKKRQYLEDKLSFGKIATAGITRAGIFSLAGFGTDAYSALTGADSFRTSTDNTSNYGNSGYGGPKTASQLVGNVAKQFPVTNLVNNGLQAGRSVGHIASEGYVSERDFKNFTRLLPLQSAVPMAYLSNLMLDELDLPEK